MVVIRSDLGFGFMNPIRLPGKVSPEGYTTIWVRGEEFSKIQNSFWNSLFQDNGQIILFPGKG